VELIYAPQHLEEGIEALAAFLDTENGKNLLAGYRRAANILRIEEKKDGVTYSGAPDPELYRQAEERAGWVRLPR